VLESTWKRIIIATDGVTSRWKVKQGVECRV